MRPEAWVMIAVLLAPLVIQIIIEAWGLIREDKDMYTEDMTLDEAREHLDTLEGIVNDQDSDPEQVAQAGWDLQDIRDRISELEA